MEDISNQITRLSQALKSFQAQLQWKNFQGSNPGDQDRVMDGLLNAGVGQDLKRTVDLLSHFLWCYIESAATGVKADDVDYARQSSRLGQITGILRMLHHSSCPLKDSLAFVEHAAMTITGHVDSRGDQNSQSLEKTA